jgi:opacity protein-like surface antigen
MKNLILLLLTTSIVFKSSANDSTSNNKIQIDLNVNATKFVKQFVNFNNSNFEISPYLFGMRVIKGKNNFRWNYGIDYNTNTVSGSNGESSIQNNNQNFRLGYLREVVISKKFSSYLGPDFVLSYLENKTKSGGNGFTSERSQRQSGVGLGLNFGFQWNLTSRIAIYTESTLLMESQSGDIKNKTSSGGQTFEENSNIRGSSVRFVAPTSLFFHYKF